MFILPAGDAYDFVINLVRLTFIPLERQLTTHASASTDHIPPRRHQRHYFLWHHLPLAMAQRQMGHHKRPSAVGSRFFRSGKRLPFRLPSCAPTRRPRAIYQFTLLVACHSRLGHFWPRLRLLAGLGACAASDERVHTC